MKLTTFVRRTFGLAAILVVAGGCADSPLSPNTTPAVAATAAAPDANLLGGGLEPVLDPVYGLLFPTKAVARTTALAKDVIVSKTIGSAGGTLSIPSLGLTLTVPKGAVSGPTTFSATAIAGTVVAYDFEPHGATFAKALTITQSLTGTDWYQKGYSSAKGGYYQDRSLIDQVLNIVWTLELLPATVTSGSVQFQVKHFSGYMVAGC